MKYTQHAASLKNRLSGGRGLAHAYIVSGADKASRREMADWLSAAYVCTGQGRVPCGACRDCRKAAGGIHPDIIWAGLDGGISAAEARALRTDAFIRPNEAPRKVYLLENVDQMNATAQNALLKVLEEGPDYAAFLLLTENDMAALPTIRSRCETVRLAPDAGAETGEDSQTARELAALLESGSESDLVTFAVSLERRDRASLSVLLDETLACLRDRLSRCPENAGRVMALAGHVRALRAACDFNIGAGHLAGWLAAGAGEETNKAGGYSWQKL